MNCNSCGDRNDNEILNGTTIGHRQYQLKNPLQESPFPLNLDIGAVN